MASTNKALFESVAERLIEQLEKGTSIFQQPWQNRMVAPFNPTTGSNYRGLNSLWLQMQGHNDPRWLTFKQAQAKDWQVVKGEKGTMINIYKTHQAITKRDASGKELKDDQGKPLRGYIELDRPIITSAIVFNASQIKGIPELKYDENDVHRWADLDRVEKIVKNSGMDLHHGGDHAFYNPLADRVIMPLKEQFPKQEDYYATLMHEMAHWTGHHTRLDRPIINKFGTPEYAKEELRAEIASLLMGSELKVGMDFDQNAAYVKSWISVLKNDPLEIYRAAADAQKITSYIMGFEQKRAVDQKQNATFMLNDNINYKGENYRVTALLPARKVQFTIESSGKVLNIGPKDRIYLSLSNALTQGQGTEQNLKQSQAHDNDKDISRGTGYKR